MAAALSTATKLDQRVVLVVAAVPEICVYSAPTVCLSKCKYLLALEVLVVPLEREPELAIVDQAAAIPHLAVLFWPEVAEQEVED